MNIQITESKLFFISLQALGVKDCCAQPWCEYYHTTTGKQLTVMYVCVVASSTYGACLVYLIIKPSQTPNELFVPVLVVVGWFESALRRIHGNSHCGGNCSLPPDFKTPPSHSVIKSKILFLQCSDLKTVRSSACDPNSAGVAGAPQSVVIVINNTRNKRYSELSGFWETAGQQPVATYH